MNTITWAGLLPTLPAILGVAVALAVELVTKATAPAWLKRSLAVALAVLAGVLPTIAYNPHNVPAYLEAVALAWAVTMATHVSGLTSALQDATATFGLGPSGKTTPPGGTPMSAGGVSTMPATVGTAPAATPAAAAPVPIVHQS